MVFATGLFFVQAPATAVPVPGPDNPNVRFVEGTPHSDHTFEGPDASPSDTAPDNTVAATGPSGDIRVRLVTAKLADNGNPVSMAGAENAVVSTSNYWKAMTNNKLSMTVNSRVEGFQSKARSADSYGTIISTITSELQWSASPYTALVIFIPTSTLSGNALGAGYSSGAYSGRVLMPQLSNFSNNVMSHEFGHVIGLMHADALQCGSGASDVGVNSDGRFTDPSCYIREYGDTTDLMGAAQYAQPVVSSTFWDYARLGRGDEIRDVGVATGVKSYTLKPWGGTDAQRAIKFTDPISKEVYYLELREPAGYDSYLGDAGRPQGNMGVKVVQRGGATIASSLILMPSTVPFTEPYYAKNHAWQAGSTFTTYTGTQVTINAVSKTSASVTINADVNLKTRISFSAGDFDGDKLADVVSREADGSLVLFAGLPGNRLEDPVRIGTGWDIFNSVFGTSDFNGDGFADIMARASDGTLWLYPGNGKGGFLPRAQIGVGWQGFTKLVAPGDFNGDGWSDVIAADSEGLLWLYPGNGSGGFLPPIRIGQGWDVFTSLAPAGTFGGGSAGLLARSADGTLFSYPGDGKGAFLPRSAVGSGWNLAGDIMGGQDFTGDRIADVLGNGSAMTLYPGDGSGFADRLTIGTGWNQFSQVWEAGDFDGDGVADILARATNGVLWLYPGNGSGGFLPRVQVGSGWNVFTSVVSAGDFDGDAHPDLVARASDGSLWLYPTDGKAQFLARRQIGEGWQGFTQLLAPGDFTGDGRADIVGQTADGVLWVYPGNGAGGFLARKQIGTGWDMFNLVLQAGDFNGDGKEDLLGRAPDGGLWLYPGNGSGGFLARSYLGSGWNMFSNIAALGNGFTGTGDPSVVGVASDGTLLLYSGTGAGQFKPVSLNPR
ncbi:VCBS repeat-containing protein [Arthrobacter sp. fls2-241-R2A-172]|uniref:FG-GAP repeat domain-containing protein n=1 Tax=Arthrobacter sp. fls2-241-R2A-172 TaxID=3040325 RepID=UPI00254F8D83|nr:VCBS repeat-containing protein [Arthrobacter sp. fls2-241-R2A-172]